MRQVLLVIVMSWLGIAVARAEPGPVTGYLMATPTSLFSFGMYQLRIEIESSGDRIQRVFRAKVTTSVAYDWDRNRIRIAYLVASTPQTLRETNKARCRALINFVKQRALIDPKSGNPVNPKILKHSKLAAFFQELGFEKSDTPSNYETKVDRIIELTAVVGTDKNGKAQSNAVSCEAPLRSKKVLFPQ